MAKQTVFTIWMVFLSFGMEAGTPLKVVVWDFGAQEEKLTWLAVALQKDFQKEVELFSYYQLLTADASTALPDSLNIYGRSNLPKAVRDSLEAKRVEGVFYGYLSKDEESGAYVLECKLEDLKGRSLKQGRITIERAKADKEKELAKLIQTLFRQMHEKERVDQYDLISIRLSRYTSTLKDLKRQIQRMDRDVLRDGFMRDFRFYVMSYEEIIFDLLDRGAIYKTDFGQLWPKKYSRDLNRLFDEELEYFHFTYIDEPLRELVSIAADFSTERSEEKRYELMKELLERRQALLQNLEIHFPEVRTTVYDFLQRCDAELEASD